MFIAKKVIIFTKKHVAHGFYNRVLSIFKSITAVGIASTYRSSYHFFSQTTQQ